MKKSSIFFKRRSGGLILLLFLALGLNAQRPKVDTLFNIESVTDSIIYVEVGRSQTSVESEIHFWGLDCIDATMRIGKGMIKQTFNQEGSGIFPETFGELENPIVLDSTAIDSDGDLMFRKSTKLGNTWNFSVKFATWDSYYLVFILEDVGTCTEGKIWRVR